MLMRFQSLSIFAIVLTTIQTFSFGQDTVRNVETQTNTTDDDITIESLNQIPNVNISSVSESHHPSISPTNAASSSPSFLPTSSPTPECHDLASYRSPINDFTCRDHRNTDCTKWKYLGLTDYQVLELLRSCPVSCRVDCGHSFEPSSSPTFISSISPSIASILMPFEIEMYILNQSIPFSEEELEEFENITSIYLISRIYSENIQLESFRVSSQTILNGRRLLRGGSSMVDQRVLKVLARVIMRVLKGEDSNLTNSTVLQQMVISSLGSDDFRIYAQQIDMLSHFEVVFELDNSTVNPELIKEPKTEEEIPPNKRSTSAAAAIVSSIVIVTVVFGIAFYLHRQKRFSGFHSWIVRVIKRDSADSSDDMNNRSSSRDEESIGSDGPGKVDGVCVSRVLSQNSSDEKSFHFDVKVDSCNDNQSGARGDSDEEVTIRNRSSKKTFRSPHLLNNSQADYSSKTQIKHIPTMIVIDNIDEEELTSPAKIENMSSVFDESPAQKEVRSLYVKRIEATSDMVAALSGRKDVNPIRAYNLLHPWRYNDNLRLFNEEISPHTGTSSRLSIGDTTSLSTPCAENEDDIKVEEKRVFTFNSGQNDDFTILFERKMKQDEEKSAQKMSLRGFFKRKKKTDVGDESVHSEASHYESDAEVSEVSEVVREKDRSEESNLQKQILDVMAIYNDNSLGQRDDNESTEIDYDPNELLGDLPTDTANHRHSKSSSTTSFNFSHKRSISEFSLSTGYTYSFLAPKTGKLGIIIQSNGLAPPTIFQVKDYSPLFGQVEPGDKIVAVDGQDTSKMSTTEITQLLAAKRSGNTDRTSRIKITVVSRNQKEGLQATVDSTIPDNIDIVDTVVEVRDDMEVSQSGEKKRREECSNASSSSDDEHSCHLLGTVNSDDWNEADDMEVSVTHQYADQFL